MKSAQRESLVLQKSLFSPCRLFTFADNAYLGLSCMVGMSYINRDILQALSLARDCRASHVALVNMRRVQLALGLFSSNIPRNDWAMNVYSVTDRHYRLLQFLTY